MTHPLTIRHNETESSPTALRFPQKKCCSCRCGLEISKIRRWSEICRYFWLLASAWLAVSPLTLAPAAQVDVVGDRESVGDFRDGWLQLFDRETVFGWRGVNPSSVRDGKLIIEPADGMPRTSSQFADFQMSVRYRLSAGGEAELRLRTNPRGTEVGRDYLPVELEPGEGYQETRSASNPASNSYG
jgi:hypothetical protein